MKAFKIVSLDKEGRMLSVMSVRSRKEGQLSNWFLLPDSWTVVYRRNRWTRAKKRQADKGLHILVFGDFEDAVRTYINMSDSFIRCQIWTVEAEGVTVPPDVEFRRLPRGGDARQMTKDSRISGWPSGTLMAVRVKLIRQVYPT